MRPRVAWRGRALLGEGPVWDRRDGCLWFVDIKGQLIHRLEATTGQSRSWQAPAQVGWVLPAAGGGFLAGLKDGLCHFTPEDGAFRSIAAVERDQPGNRLNDATAGPEGMVWFGSMDDGTTRKTGHVYCWDGQKVRKTSIPAVAVTNGPAVAPDGRTLYHVDTVGGTVYALPLGPGGIAGPGEAFVRINRREGYPDGVTVDAGGNVWVGIWAGSCARCYAPDGSLVRQVDLPATNVTKIALGGADLRTAFATTARVDLDDDVLAREPGAGSVFAFEVDVPGQSYPLVRIS